MDQLQKKIDAIDIISPKRPSKKLAGWDGFFPYYAGYPTEFAARVLSSYKLSSKDLVFDPWCGSGTTAYAANSIGLRSQSLDINPAMILIARARLFSPADADALIPLANKILSASYSLKRIHETDPLLSWFSKPLAMSIRSIERQIANHVVGEKTIEYSNKNLKHISTIAAALYVALFSAVRKLSIRFRTSNPTWVRVPRPDESVVDICPNQLRDTFIESAKDMAKALFERCESSRPVNAYTDIICENSTTFKSKGRHVDFVLTSPPYCTRIDYTVSTRMELAVLWPLLDSVEQELRVKQIGSLLSPSKKIVPDIKWGYTCLDFLEKLRMHESKASSGYYLNTHLDYYYKIYLSIKMISDSCKEGAVMVTVIQDSFYKNIYNDVPKIFSEMALHCGFELRRKEIFESSLHMSRINSRARQYRELSKPRESVLCFERVR